MASGGSSGRAASEPRSFDFGSDDVLCSYDGYRPQEPPNGSRSDPSIKDFHESRIGRPLSSVYSQQEEYPKEDVISVVEKCMKKYADNLLQFLEGISGRLSQLELHSYKLERSIGEFRSDMVRDQSETDLKLKSLEKHLQEVHRSVQILRDKQELAEAQKELAKLQLEQKESINLSRSQKNEAGVAPSISEPKKHDDMPDEPNHQLALVPRQTTAPLPARPSEQNHQYKELPLQQPLPAPPPNMTADRYMNQAATFYGQHQPLPQDQRNQPLQPELQYVQPRPQIQDQSPATPLPFPQYQLQWPQSPQLFPQQPVPSQQPVSQAQIHPQTPPTYPPYPQQTTNPISGTFMQVSYSTLPQPGGNRAEAVPFGYGGPGGAVSQPPPQHNAQRQQQPQVGQGSFGPPVNKGGYTTTAPYPPQPTVQGYNTMYGVDGSRGAHSQNFHPGSYPPPTNAPALQSQQLMRNHPYGEMIEKAVSMGYPRNVVVSVIQRMGETGQPVDVNALIDRLDTGASPRGWSA